MTLGLGAAVLFLLLRLLAVSDWNWRTASEIMAVTDIDGVATIILGTLMADSAYTAALVVMALPIAVLHLVWPIDKNRSVADTVLVTAVLTASAISLIHTFTYWWLPVAAAVLAGVVVAARLMWRHGRRREVVVFLFRRTRLIAGVLLLVLAGVLTTPWVPEEAITTDSGMVHGYVLEAEPGFLTVLTEPDRKIEVLPIATVRSRQ
ncbi:hypothetical protein GCM10023147_41690 [Tsukamurella soli]|uniref:Uncharacterized protein n=1 Tax=Tsukamurella soli TaxID=644556 RepID=A0ABP8K8C2_9ACTN